MTITSETTVRKHGTKRKESKYMLIPRDMAEFVEVGTYKIVMQIKGKKFRSLTLIEKE